MLLPWGLGFNIRIWGAHKHSGQPVVVMSVINSEGIKKHKYS
jgi:hypothetical protein